MTVNVYSSSNNVEKLNIVLPNDDIVDIDLIPDENPELNSNQSYIKITYLSENKTDGKNGFALEINKELIIKIKNTKIHNNFFLDVFLVINSIPP